MIQHEVQNNHGDSGIEFLPMEMLALTPLYSGESFSDVNGAYSETSFPAPFFAFGDSDDEDDDMEEDDFDDMEEEEFDDDEEEDFNDEDEDDDDDEDEDDDDDDEFDEDEDDDYDYDDDDDFEYDDE